MYSTAFWYLFVVLLVFLALLRNHWNLQLHRDYPLLRGQY